MSAKGKTAMPCCDMMRSQLEHRCDVHSPRECPDCVVVHLENREVVIPIRDGGSSFIEIEFCPWCGRKIFTTEAVK